MEGIEGIVYTAIFHTPIRNVKGYCAYITEKEIIILFWGFDDLKEKDIFDWIFYKLYNKILLKYIAVKRKLRVPLKAYGRKGGI